MQHTVSSKTLIKATIGALLVAAVTLILFILPAEYNIDPTGLGTQLQALAQKHNLSVQRLVNDDALLTIVPNTPAAILLNKHGELVYAGPLSEGIACSTGSGFVELAINNLQAGFNSNLKLSQAKGCYCHSP